MVRIISHVDKRQMAVLPYKPLSRLWQDDTRRAPFSFEMEYRMPLTKEQFLTYFDYDEEHGKLYWKEKTHDAFANSLIGREAGNVDEDGYIRVSIFCEKYKVHQIIWFLHTGEWSSLIDHIDNDQGNNRFSNLRPATNQQNQWNKKVQETNKLKVKGVSLCKATNRYRADICVNGLRINLGRFDTVDEAAEAYKKKASESFGSFARVA